MPKDTLTLTPAQLNDPAFDLEGAMAELTSRRVQAIVAAQIAHTFEGGFNPNPNIEESQEVPVEIDDQLRPGTIEIESSLKGLKFRTTTEVSEIIVARGIAIKTES